MNKTVRYYSILLLLSCSIMMSSSCGPKKVDYASLQRTTTQKEMIQTIGSEPTKTTQTEDGGTDYTYENSVYEDYTGTISYRYYDDMLFYSKWTYEEKNEDTAKEIYNDICEKLKKQYGSGTTTDENQSTTFETDEKYVIAAYGQQDDIYTVCITEMMK